VSTTSHHREAQRLLIKPFARRRRGARIGGVSSVSLGSWSAAPIAANRAAFLVPDEVAYFNTASLAPMLRSVRAAGAAALEQRARPWDIADDDWFTAVERLRRLVGRLFGDADGVALVPATSYGFATAAANLPVPAGSAIIVLAGEYPSGIYTWRRHATRHGARILTVAVEDGQDWTEAVLAAIGDATSVVSVPQVHWTDGAWLDLVRVARRAHDVGAALVIDASQSLGVVPLDVSVLQPDFVVSVGYKWLLGPFGRGYLWVAPAHRDGQPIEENWIARKDAEQFASLVDYRDEYQAGARRFDQGARTLFELTPMAIAAMTQILEWQVEHIAASLSAITARIESRLTGLGLDSPTRQRGPHLLGLPLPVGTAEHVTSTLADRGVYAAVRGPALRISPHLHTNDEDIDRLVDALAAAL
jgi:selenocysteine lyase/cysteine desulfurase